MNYECGPLLLTSCDKVRMLDFLSDVFEFDVDHVEECVVHGSLVLKICEGNSIGNDLNPKGIIFSFRVKGEGDIKEIINKFNFFLYRKNSSPEGPSHLEQIDLKQTDQKIILTLTDIDRRLWQFEWDKNRNFFE